MADGQNNGAQPKVFIPANMKPQDLDAMRFRLTSLIDKQFEKAELTSIELAFQQDKKLNICANPWVVYK